MAVLRSQVARLSGILKKNSTSHRHRRRCHRYDCVFLMSFGAECAVAHMRARTRTRARALRVSFEFELHWRSKRLCDFCVDVDERALDLRARQRRVCFARRPHEETVV